MTRHATGTGDRTHFREHTVEVTSSTTYPDLTSSVNQLCDQIDHDRVPAIAVLRVGRADGEPAWPQPPDVQHVNQWERAVRRVERLDAVTIAVAAGDCGGPAFDLFLAADHRVATEGARLVVARPNAPMWPGMQLYRLTHQVGVHRARRLLLSGGVVAADRAMDFGLIGEIVEDGGEAVRRVVKDLDPVLAADFAIRRQLLQEAATTSFEEALGVHLAACDRELRRHRSVPS